ncbi:MAG: imidazole glycerol phosphate synthase subunit HisH [Deltaproteobacteria bacterium]|jgi:glutamine amidotransferase|nr:imidazole glycerol phosphate synthase subunit HisH [Deltaproteobacteria bacterium]
MPHQAHDYLAIIEYKAGNQTSVRRALKHIGVNAVVTSDLVTLSKAAGIIFPGVGAAGQAMPVLRETGLGNIIKDLASRGRPLLGICLGCQIMLDHSDENDTETLGIFRGNNVRFDSGRLDEDGRPIRVPHIGWNTVRLSKETALWEGVGPDEQFYFVHSYTPVPEPEVVMGTTYHGGEFASVFGKEGTWALQFHPEKSGPPGLRLLANFYRYSVKAAEAD